MMTDNTKIKFINYDLRKEVTTPKYKCETEAIQSPEPVNIPLEPKNKPMLLINVFDPKNPNTNYTNTINHQKLKNALFIYLSNNENSGYAGGGKSVGSLGTALIGDYEHTFGIITGQWDTTSKIPKNLKNNSIPEYGFQNLNEQETFKLCHRADRNTYNMTPKQAIDYLLGQLYELIQKNKYAYIILPCDLVTKSTKADYHNYTLGAGLFNSHLEVKRYIYEKICNFTKVNEPDGWQLITDFLKE